MSNALDTLTIDPMAMGIQHRFGPGSEFNGTLKLAGGALFEGDVSGALHVQGTLVIWSGATIRGSIRVDGDLYLFGAVGDPGCAPDEAAVECHGTAYLAASSVLNGRVTAKHLQIYHGADLRGQVRSLSSAHRLSPHVSTVDERVTGEAAEVVDEIDAHFRGFGHPVPAFSR